MTEGTSRIKAGVPKETFPGERRVALIPEHITALSKSGIDVFIEKGAGEPAGFADSDYEKPGATMVADRSELFSTVDLILQVRAYGANPTEGQNDLERIKQGQTIIGHHEPLSEPEKARELAQKGVTAFAMELMPRITRAQSMDTLSSMATIAGYKAVIMAADTLPKMFPMLMTAAGTIAPAKVFVIGAGVAGLQAIATAKRLGAVVQAYDVRPAVKEQVESLGAKFVEFELETQGAEDAGGYAKAQDEEFYRKQREMMTKVLADNDVTITTAAIPGKKAPILITGEMVKQMQLGSLIVDLAAERGGNCELTKPGETVVENGVTILGPENLPSTIPSHASRMYSKNLTTFLQHLVKDGRMDLNLEDEITKGTLVAQNGDVVHERIKELLSS